MNSEKTALSRKGPSVPTKKLFPEISNGLPVAIHNRILNPNPEKTRILDYGCGKGADVDYLLQKGYQVHGYDPHFQPILHNIKYDIIICNYVFNVISKTARKIALQDILSRLNHNGVAYISVRADKIPGTPHEDGVVTSKKTFQKSFTENEIIALTNGDVIFSNSSFITVKISAETKKHKTLSPRRTR